MSDQRIDKVFHNKLSDRTIPVPEDMWKNIEKQLPAPRKRLPWGPLGILAGSVIAISALIAWSTMEKPLQEESIPVSVVNPASELSSPSPAVIETKENIAPDATQSTNALTPSGDDLTASREEAGTVDATTSNTTQSKNTTAHKSTSRKSAETSGTRSGSTANQPGSSMSISSGESSNQNAQTAQSSGIQSETGSSESMESGSSISVSMSSVVRNKLTEVKLLDGGTTLLHINPRKLPDPAKDCYRFGKKNSGGGGVIFAEVYGGPMTSLKSMESRDEDVSDYITARDTSEDMRLSWNAGVRVGYWHHSGLTVRTGAHYSLVNERFHYTNGSFIKWIEVIDTIFDGGGNIVDIDTTLTPVSGTRIKKTYNRYHTVDVPLLVGFQLAHERWTYGIQAGPMFNVAFSRKGEIFNTSIDPDTITSDDPNEYPAFKDKLGMSLYASVHLGYRIGSAMWVYAEPYFHRRLKSITLESYPIDQRQTNIGLSIGLRVNLR